MKRSVTLEADVGELFDAVRKMDDGGAAAGARIVSLLLGGHAGREEIGLAVYGVTVRSIEEVV